MRKLREVVENPSALDSLSNYAGDLPSGEWYCFLVRTRDSTVLEESNFMVALENLGGEGENVRIDRFGHWACGWWESLSVRENTREYEIAECMESDLEGYPVLNEFDYRERLEEAALNVFDTTEAIEWLFQIEFIDKPDIEELEELSENELIDLIEEHYEGGIVEFCHVE